MGGHKNVYDEGRKAFADGACRSSNPYPKGRINAVRWNMGYLDARGEDDFLDKWMEGRI